MARIRSIKPDFFLHEGLTALPATARLLFIGLWTLADKEGRLEDRPRRIKASLFPYEELDIEALLSALDRGDHIHRYEVGGDHFIAIPAWSKHQRPHPKETSAAIPCPPSREKKRQEIKDQPSIPSSPGGREGKELLVSGNGRSLEEASAPAKEAVEPPRIANPDSPSLKFFVRAEDTRTAAGLAREKPPHPGKLAAWYSFALGELGGDEARLWEAWLTFGDDPYWQERKCPFNGFASQWEKYAPRTSPSTG